VHSVLNWLTTEKKILQLEIDVLEMLTVELKQQVNSLGHLNLVVSRMPIEILQDLQTCLLQAIKNKGEEAKKEITGIMDERVQLQQQYDVTLQQKKEFEVQVEEVLKDKTEAKERLKKSLKEKDEVENIE
jgi:hypothetical protein